MVRMEEVEIIDSGVESMPESSKDLTPEKMPQIEDDYENEEDESLAERLLGLTEMFPDLIRNASYYSFMGCKKGIKSVFNFSKSASWIFFSTGLVLFAPLMLEVERTQFLSAQQSQQKQVLLGPSSAMSHNPLGPGMPGMPPGPPR